MEIKSIKMCNTLLFSTISFVRKYKPALIPVDRRPRGLFWYQLYVMVDLEQELQEREKMVEVHRKHKKKEEADINRFLESHNNLFQGAKIYYLIRM